MNETTSRHTLVHAAVGDASGICELVNSFARTGEMLPRTMSEVIDAFRSYMPFRDAAAS